LFLPSSPSSPLPPRELDLRQRRSSSSLFDSLRNKRVEVDICTPSDTGRFAFHPLMTNSQAAVASLLPSFPLSSFTPLSSVNSCCNQQVPTIIFNIKNSECSSSAVSPLAKWSLTTSFIYSQRRVCVNSSFIYRLSRLQNVSALPDHSFLLLTDK